MKAKLTRKQRVALEKAKRQAIKDISVAMGINQNALAGILSVGGIELLMQNI